MIATEIATETGWIDMPYDASNFSAQAPLRWKVSDTNVLTYAYCLLGKTMTLAFSVENSRLELDDVSGNIPSKELHLTLPNSYLPARGTANPIWMGSVAFRECGYARVHPGHEKVILFRGAEERFPIDPGHFCVFGQLTFEVQ